MKKKPHKRMMDGGMAVMGMPRGAEPPRKIVQPPRPPRGGGVGAGYSDAGMAAMPPRTNPIGRPVGGLGMATGLMGTPRGVPVAMKKGGAVKGKKMRGGGLARKGVGMALAKGGLAKRAGGCAKRGVGRGKMM